MVPAILLAAGSSRRMGAPKALLSWEGETWVARAVGQMRAAGIMDIVVVAGKEFAAVKHEVGNRARVVPNPRHADGMMTSIQCGLRSISHYADAVLMSLVDLPNLRAQDYLTVLAAFAAARPDLIRPRFNGQPAHPAIVGRKYFAEIRNQSSADSGCGYLFSKYPKNVLWLDVDNARGTRDIDFVEELHANFAP